MLSVKSHQVCIIIEGNAPSLSIPGKFGMEDSHLVHTPGLVEDQHRYHLFNRSKMPDTEKVKKKTVSSYIIIVGVQYSTLNMGSTVAPIFL